MGLGYAVSREMVVVKPVILQCLEHAKHGDLEVETGAGAGAMNPPLVCPLALPAGDGNIADDDPDSALSANTYEHAVRKEVISKDIGYGLVATEPIPAGSVIFADRVACIGIEEIARGKTLKARNELGAGRVKAMGDEWHRAFLALPNPLRRVRNEYAQIWQRYQMIAVRKRTRVMVAGPRIGLVNHSCVPNAFLYYTLRYPKNQGGVEDKSKPPTIGRAVVRASVDIKPGDEITVSYFYAKGEHSVRQLMSSMYCQFSCYCPHCSDPDPQIEELLERYYQLGFIFEDAEVVYKWPAVAYRAAYDLIKVFEYLKVNDPRVIHPWLCCAMIAGFNSDLGRALQFLIKAHTLILQMQGPNGHLYDRVSSWMQTISLMPGFGATTRGLSNVAEGYQMAKDQEYFHNVLFMLDAKPDEYIRLHCYRHLPDCQVKQDESRLTIRFDVEDINRKGFENEESSPVEVKPWWMDFEINQATGENVKPQRKKRTVKKTEDVTKKKMAVRPIPQLRDSDCIEPEKDFLDICRVLLKEFLAEERKEGKQKKDQDEQKLDKQEKAESQKNSNRPQVRLQKVPLRALKGRLKPVLQTSPPVHQRVRQPIVRKTPAKNPVVVKKAPISFRLEESATLEM